MLERSETKALLEYVLNSLTSKKMNAKALGELCEWIGDSLDLLGLDPLDPKSVKMMAGLRAIQEAESHRVGVLLGSYLKMHLPYFRQHLQRLGRGSKSRLSANLKVVSEAMELTGEEAAVLALYARYHGIKAVEDFCDTLARANIKPDFAIAFLAGIPVDHVGRLLGRQGSLARLGLIEPSAQKMIRYLSDISMPESVLTALFQADGTIDGFRRLVLGDAAHPSLDWQSFSHLQPSADRLAAFLAKACAMKLGGINILLYGPPGTGKTEFSKTLAHHLGLSLYAVCEADHEGGEPTRTERLNSLRMAQSLLSDQQGNLLLFDEMDDLFQSSFMSLFGGRPSNSSKIFGNRLLENNPVPTLWTINSPDLLDPANLRRMAFAMEIKTPPVQGRVRVWQQVLDKHGVSVSAEDLESLADQDDVPPGVVENAVRFAKLSGGDVDDIRFVAEGIVKVMGGSRRRTRRKDAREEFLPGLVNADLDLGQLTGRLSRPDAPRNLSLCLYGPSGTGKSAYARYLAEQMGLEVLYRRASDLLDRYVGSSEKNIAAMFEQAAEEGRLLILDEADSLLRERSGAMHRWEVSQVNEMLTWMERHPLPFVCTTNLMDQLDQASLRRFTFKVRFDYLARPQIGEAFRFFLGQDCPAGEAALTHVTPGDFATVQRKARLLGEMEDPVKLLELLEAEQGAKKVVRGKIGFA